MLWAYNESRPCLVYEESRLILVYKEVRPCLVYKESRLCLVSGETRGFWCLPQLGCVRYWQEFLGPTYGRRHSHADEGLTHYWPAIPIFILLRGPAG